MPKQRITKSPGAAATVHGAKDVDLGRPTSSHTPKAGVAARKKSYQPAGWPDHIDGPIYSFEKLGGRMKVIAGARHFHGHERFDIREWCNGKIGTRKGVSIPIDEARKLAEAIIAWDNHRRLGWGAPETT
ncbi:MAG: PC4/YdbC family ssDNA-binding protein [Marinosulfonomonas sp.]